MSNRLNTEALDQIKKQLNEVSEWGRQERRASRLWAIVWLICAICLLSFMTWGVLMGQIGWAIVVILLIPGACSLYFSWKVFLYSKSW